MYIEKETERDRKYWGMDGDWLRSSRPLCPAPVAKQEEDLQAEHVGLGHAVAPEQMQHVGGNMKRAQG